MVPEIWSATDRIFCHFGLFFDILPPSQSKKSKFWKNEKNSQRYYHFTQAYHKWRSYDIWFLRYGAQQTEFFVILDHFFSFYPSNNLKNQNFEKTKKTPGDIIILHMCTINDDHMIYGSWDMERDRQNFLSFWSVFFFTFTPLTTQKIKILKKWKTAWRFYNFTHVYSKWQSYDVWFLRYGVWRTEFFVILDHFLLFYP